MTKQNILNMKSAWEIGHTMFTDPELWDEEIKDHWVKTAKRERLEKYGCEDFLPTIPKRKRE